MYHYTMGKWKHRLTELDRDSGKAICDECGPVQAKWRQHKNGWRCPVAVRNQKVPGREYESESDGLRKLEDQGHVCAICREDKRLYRDHDHSTGLDRGYLCHNCNVGLGHFFDNVDNLQRAVEYLGLHA